MGLNVYLSEQSEVSVAQVMLVSFFSGFALHLAIGTSSIEFERYIVHALAIASLAYCSILTVCIWRYSQGIFVTTAFTNLACTGFITGAIISLAIYRLLLHRCRTFPGPPLAGLSRFYLASLNANRSNTQYYQELQGLHKKHGDYVRIGPREISILDKNAIPLIYGSKSECRKSTWYNGAGFDPDKLSIGSIRDPMKYKRRRRAWDHGLSTKSKELPLQLALRLRLEVFPTYEPCVKAKADVLVKQLNERSGLPIDSTAWSMFYSFDVMGEVAFSHDFGNLKTGNEHPGIQVMHSFLGVASVIQPLPWLVNLLSMLPGAAQALIKLDSVSMDVLAQKEATWNSDEQPADVVSWFLKAIKDKDTSASPTRKSLLADTRSVIIAGSDTTASTLANVLFYLASHTAVQHKLRTLLDEALPGGYSTWSYPAVRKVSYIDDIINETLRLKPPIIQGVPRETPPQGLQIGDMYIPGRVSVIVPTISIQRDPRWWKEANDFIPERWSERKDEMGTEDAPWLPFNRGLHHCAGKDVAYLTLRTAISAVVQNFHITFAPEEDVERQKTFDEKFLSSLLMQPRPLRLVFTTRPVEEKA